MKRLLLFSVFLLMLGRIAMGATNNYVNNGTFQSPPSPFPAIDATNVSNAGLFEIDTILTASQLTGILSYTPFDFSDMQNFSNGANATMICNSGFNFSNMPIGSGTNVPSATFFNAGGGQIIANGITFVTNSTVTVNFIIFGNIFDIGPSITISATNIVNNGLLEVSENGLMTLTGNSVDLTRGTLGIDGLQIVGASLGGVFEDYWTIGLETNQLSRNFNFSLPSPTSPGFVATNPQFLNVGEVVSPLDTGSNAFANLVQVNASNLTTQVVYVGNTNTNITVDVRFEPTGDFATPIVRLQSILTNSFGVAVTNVVLISDFFGSETNFQLITNSLTSTTAPLLSPINYTVFAGNATNLNLSLFGLGFFGFTNFTSLPIGNTPFDPTLLPVGNITNQYTALGVELNASTFIPDPNLPGQNLTNIPGRIVITASNYLNMALTKINGPNVLRIKSTNHFAGSAGAKIASPNMDINLGTTNGQLNVTNLIAPFIPDLVGTIGLYSARWTNVVSGFTNSYHVFMVDARLASTALPLLQNLQLRSTNVAISDQINIASNLLINATSLTITSNSANQFTPYGQINLLSPNLVWSANLPALQFMTNFGLISMPNTVYFAEVGQIPFFTTNFTSNYQAFINHGTIISSGNTTWSQYYENTGVPTNATGIPYIVTNQSNLPAPTNSALVYSTFGPISIIATNALLANGSFISASGDLDFSADNLVVSNHSLLANGTINLTVRSNITDTGLSSNFWSVRNGINLLIKPATGDLLGTTITNFCPAGFEITNMWAGKDRGVSPAGFLNNGAVGHMIVDGADADSTFAFVGPDSTNAYAIYVDEIELKDFATNTITVNNSPFFSAFDIATNVTVYFADAMLGQFDISEKLNGANGGRLVWVPSYAGFFSSTNLVYPAGVTNTFNRALVISTDIDSNGNGTANAFDSTPIFTASMVNLKFAFTNVSSITTPALSWFALANATNILYYQSNLFGPPVVITSFVQPFPSANVTKVDTGRTNSAGFYKVQINSIQP